MVYNPSLREESRNKRAEVIPLKQESSILDWLENSGRLLARDNVDFDYLDDEEEIADLMGSDDASFDLDDDDDDLDLEE
jgi:phosphopantothenoylcysteine synthetase/decarboxylase